MDVDEPLEELDPSRCWDLLRTQAVGRLGVAIANRPDMFPVNFVVDGETIVFRTAEGTKLAAALLGTAVAFEADDERDGTAWSVVVKGHAREIENMYELFDAEELPLYPWHSSPKYRFVRIEPTEISGRSFRAIKRSAGDAEP